MKCLKVYSNVMFVCLHFEPVLHHILAAVSYTHLDVYKRQDLPRMGRTDLHEPLKIYSF